MRIERTWRRGLGYRHDAGDGRPPVAPARRYRGGDTPDARRNRTAPGHRWGDGCFLGARREQRRSLPACRGSPGRHVFGQLRRCDSRNCTHHCSAGQWRADSLRVAHAASRWLHSNRRCGQREAPIRAREGSPVALSPPATCIAGVFPVSVYAAMASREATRETLYQASNPHSSRMDISGPMSPRGATTSAPSPVPASSIVGAMALSVGSAMAPRAVRSPQPRYQGMAPSGPFLRHCRSVHVQSPSRVRQCVGGQATSAGWERDKYRIGRARGRAGWIDLRCSEHGGFWDVWHSRWAGLLLGGNTFSRYW